MDTLKNKCNEKGICLGAVVRWCVVPVREWRMVPLRETGQEAYSLHRRHRRSKPFKFERLPSKLIEPFESKALNI